jgi:hypothetical protein
MPGSPRKRPARRLTKPKKEVAELLRDSPGITKTQFEGMLGRLISPSTKPLPKSSIAE